jgi:hypothetical protein
VGMVLLFVPFRCVHLTAVIPAKAGIYFDLSCFFLVIPAKAGIQRFVNLRFRLSPERRAKKSNAFTPFGSESLFFAHALRRRSGANSEAGGEAAEGRMPGVKKSNQKKARFA